MSVLVADRTETDPAKIQQFHEEEFQRRLRGEYQAQQLRTGQVVSLRVVLELTSGDE